MGEAPRHYLLDTNILLAYVRAGALGTYVERQYGLSASPFRPFICVVSVGEIKALAARRGWGEKRLTRMRTLLDELTWVDLGEPEVLDAYVDVVNARPRGWVIRDHDRWIAAATRATGARLLTTDTDFGYLAEAGFIQRDYIDPALGKPT